MTETKTSSNRLAHIHNFPNGKPQQEPRMNFLSTFLWAILLQCTCAKSLRGEEDDGRELTKAPNVIRTFYITFAASLPVNASTVSSTTASLVQSQTAGWIDTTYTNETLLSNNITVYTKGSPWPGLPTGRRQLTTSSCGYTCLMYNSGSCKLCGKGRMMQSNSAERFLDPNNPNNPKTIKESKDLELFYLALLSRTYTNITNLNVTVVEVTYS